MDVTTTQERSQVVKQAILSLQKIGANIMPSHGFKDKTWWVEDNGIWGLSKHEPQGLYLDDDEVVELAEKYTDFLA